MTDSIFNEWWEAEYAGKLSPDFESSYREVAERAFTVSLRCHPNEFNMWWGNEYALRLDPHFEPSFREVAEKAFNLGQQSIEG